MIPVLCMKYTVARNENKESLKLQFNSIGSQYLFNSDRTNPVIRFGFSSVYLCVV